MFTKLQLYVLFCFVIGTDINTKAELEAMEWLIEKGLLTPEGTPTDAGERVVLYATKKAEEVM